tara:strand:- start:869 stop:1663 length:795 start_codon:yes stop_codon:yes gene_type:complete
MLTIFLNRLSVILDIWKNISNNKNVTIYALLVIVVIYFNKQQLIKQFMHNTTAIIKQKHAIEFDTHIELLLDNKLEYLYKNFANNSPDFTCIAEYIVIKNDKGTIDTPSYEGSVLTAREYSPSLQKVIGNKETRLKQTHRWFSYGKDFSKKVMHRDVENHPNGVVKHIETELLNNDDPFALPMYKSFRDQDGNGNFNFRADRISYCWIWSNDQSQIIGHAIFICNKEASELIGKSNLEKAIYSLKADIVSHFNKIDETNSNDIR